MTLASNRWAIGIAVALALEAAQPVTAGKAQDSPPPLAADEVKFAPDASSPELPLTLYRRTGKIVVADQLAIRPWNGVSSSEYERLCTGRCDLRLDKGIYRFGLGIGNNPGDNVVPIRRDFGLSGGETLVAHLDDRSSLHTAGWFALALSVVGMIGIPLAVAGGHDPRAYSVPTAISVSVGALALAGAFLMILAPPTADLTLEHGSLKSG